MSTRRSMRSVAWLRFDDAEDRDDQDRGHHGDTGLVTTRPELMDRGAILRCMGELGGLDRALLRFERQWWEGVGGAT